MTVSRLLSRWPLCLIALLPASCGSGLHPVEGSVLYNGQPAAGALVAFFPADNDSLTAQVPSGQVGPDGKFTLNTNGQPGAAAGKYKVVIRLPAGKGKGDSPTGGLGAGDPENKPADQHVPGPFADRATTPLTAEVKSSSNKLEPFRLP
jgi:hypothetical protein